MANKLRMVPLLILLFLSAALGMGLFGSGSHNVVDNVNKGKKLNDFELQSLGSQQVFSPKLLGNGRVVAINVFASWCVPCASEHELLMKLAHKVNIYGIAWKDKPEDTLRFLQERGNPFQQIGIDEAGITTVPMAITGVPETYIFDKEGAIAMHYKAPLTEDVLNQVMIPLVQQLNAANAPAR